MGLKLKRFVSLILALCLMMSVFPTFAIAVGDEPQEQSATTLIYDFVLKDTNLVYDGNKSFSGANFGDNKVQTALAAYYETGAINWKFAGSNTTLLASDTVSTSYTALCGGGSYSWEGLRLGVKTTESGASDYPAGHWNAFVISIPETGEYDMTLNFQKHNSGALEGQVYILPGSYTSVSAIDLAMNASNMQGAVSFDGNRTHTNASESLGCKVLTQGEYTIVFKATQKRTGAGTAYVFLNSLVLELQESNVPQLKNETYNFALDTTDLTTANGGSWTQASLLLAANQNKIASYYIDGTLNWKYAANNLDSFKNDTNTVADTFYFGGNTYKWTGLRLGVNVKVGEEKTYPAGHYVAMTIKVPADGSYNAQLNHQTNSGGAAVADAWLIPGALTDAAAIDAAMNSDTHLGTFDCSSRANVYENVSTPLGSVDLTAGEYTLVLKATQMRTGAGTAYLYLQSLNLQQYIPGEPEETTTEATTGATEAPTTAPEETTSPEETEPSEPLNPQGYNFELGYTDLVSTGGASFKKATLTNNPFKNAINNYYDSGILSWKYAIDNLSTFKTETNTVANTFYFGGDNFAWDGLRLGMNIKEAGETSGTYAPGYWVAMTVKSPGAGNYLAVLNYQTRSDATEAGEVYLFPGAYNTVESVEEKMIEANLLDTVNFRSKSTTFADQYADMAMLSMDAGEYTIVFKATVGSASGAYMYINSLEFIHEDDVGDRPSQEEPPVEDPQPPVEEPPAEPPVITDPQGYNFELGYTDLVAVGGASFQKGTLTKPAFQNAIDAYYNAGILSWKYAIDNLSTFKTETNTVGNTFYFGGDNFAWRGLRLGMNIKEEGADTGVYAPGFWVAMTIKSPGAGKYLTTLNYQTRSDATSAGEVYLFPGTYNTVEDVEAKMNEKTLLQTINFKSATSNFEDDYAELGMLDLKAGEYTIVFKSTVGSASGAYMYINGLEFIHEDDLPEPPAPPQLDTGIYDFVLEQSDLTLNGKTFDVASYTSELVQTTLNKYYKNGLINWKYHSSYIPEGSTGSGAMFGGTAKAGTPDEKRYGWDGLRIYSAGETTPVWYAFTIQSPGSGTYYPAFNYMKQSAGAAEGSIFLLPGGTTDVAAAIANDKALAVVSYNNRKGGDAEAASEIFYDVPLNLTAGEEYVLVFTADTPGASTGDAKLAYLYLRQFILYSEKTLPDKGPNVVTYDFDLYNVPSGEFSKGAYMTETFSRLSELYKDGTLNWNYVGKCFATDYTNTKYGKNMGLIAYSNADDWYAYRIKSPGQGVYTLTMNHSISGNGATGAVYILPADTTDIEKAMDHDNRVGKVAFYNDSGDTSATTGYSTSLGTWEFGDEEEYIIVFEAYDKSPFSDRAYMYVTQIIATEGNHHAEDSTDGKQISSLVITDRAITVAEVTNYGATAVIDGVNYLFYCIEGCKMFMYNLDDMVKERVIKTPFIVSRGITIDKDGMIWLSGQSTVLFRYDPYTDVGMTTRTFGADLPGVYGGFSMATDDDGNIYMGTYQEGSVVKYVPSTDTFINMGRYNDDGYFSCGVIVNEGYLYIGVTGDTNGDGLRTTEMLKIDLETYECVARADITDYMDPKENMVRGTGIGGDTLFVGGGAMEGFVAIDINTMTVKHNYGFHKHIIGGGSGVIDGKLYFTVSGYGLQEYDIATDTVNSLGMIDYNYALKCGHTSAVYLDDPLYPGVSLVTFNAVGVAILNIDQRRADLIPTIDEEDAAGTDIISIVNGEKGSNLIYMGAFNTPNCAIYNTATGEWGQFEAVAQQTDAMVWYEGSLYTGNYTAGAITKINFNDPSRNVILFSMNNSLHQQNRVHALTAGDGKLFAGTMPYSDTYGGAFVMIDLETLENTFVRNIVQGQSITGLIYNNGYVFGTTSTTGGTGTSGPESPTDSAVIFVYDVNKKEKVAELDLRQHISGLPDRLRYVDAIAFDPNYEENGIIWGMISETLFTFTFDKDTNTFKVKEYVSYGKSIFPSAFQRESRMVSMVFHNGYIYTALGSSSGFRKISMTNPNDSERLNVPFARQFIVGEDNNLYLTTGKPELYVYPLDITDEDWEIAGAVDDMILKIGTGVTMENEQEVAAALDAYEKLSWRHKCMIQNTEILDMAKSDLLEVQIAGIGEVTIEKETLINELYEKYKALTEKQQKYVKNYDVLSAARYAVQDLINIRDAADVQKRIDALANLKPFTLEHEDQIRELRTTVNEMKQKAKQLLDLSLLLEAENAIKALRQVKIDYLCELIAKINDPVTFADEPIVTEAMEIYNWLHMEERKLVDYEKLTFANNALKKMQKAAAKEVDNLIAAIGTEITSDSGDAITAARAAYDALTPGSKAYVTMLNHLEQAEALYAQMNSPVLIFVIIAAVVVVGGAAAVLLIKRKRKSTAAAEN